jgi:DNA-binding transcriptional ArsR family regulator
MAAIVLRALMADNEYIEHGTVPWTDRLALHGAPRGSFPLSDVYGHWMLYSQSMLTLSSRVDVMNRLGRAMADPTRSRILLSLLDQPGYPAQMARDLDLTRTNVSNHLSCLRGCGIVVATPEGRQTRYEIADPHLTQAIGALVQVVLAVDDGTGCVDPDCALPLCCGAGAVA